MKIFYFSGATLPSQSAQSVHVMKMCRAFADDAKDNAVTLFAKGADAFDDEGIFRYYGVDEMFSLIISQNLKIPVLDGLLRLAGHNLGAVEAGKPDLAYGRDPADLAYVVQENVPVVYEAHQLPTSFLQKRAIDNLIRGGSLRAVVVISEALKTDFIKAFPKLKPSKIFVAPDGADVPDKAVMGKDLQGRSDALRVGYAGSLHEGKGMEVLAVLAREEPGFDFHVMGGEPTQVAEWKSRSLPGNLYMHGFVEPAEIGSYLAACDILIAPYRSKAKIKSGRDIARWISPLKIFEYMAARKPILCSDLPVLREVLTDGVNAILVPPPDVKAWVAALERLKDPALRKTLAENGFQDLLLKYSWKQRARNILKFVEKRD